MTTEPNRPAAALKPASVAAMLAIVVGSVVLVGWAFDIGVLKSLVPGWVSMKANTAVCFVLIGVALLSPTPTTATRTAGFSGLLPHFARLCGWLAGLIGLLTLGEYLLGWNPGIDQWWVHEPPGTVGTSHPGRMAPETALCFVLLATALATSRLSRNKRWGVACSVSIGLLVLTLAMAAMFTYLTPGLGAFGWFGLTIMAMHTAALFALLGVAVIARSTHQDLASWSLNKTVTLAFACGMALLVLIGLTASRTQFWLVDTQRKMLLTKE
jgi:hypothetical protein